MNSILRYKQSILFGLLSVATLVFILSNSATPAAQSNAASTEFMAWLRPLLEPLFDSQEAMHRFIRKLAHFTEYGVLGFCLGMTLDGWRCRYWQGSLVFCPLFLLLGAGVTDEFIQSFFDRTSAVKDVFLDFFGGICGALLAVVLALILEHRKKKRG